MSIPDGIWDVTAEWLTEALRTGGLSGDASVVSFRMERVGEQQGWIGELARFELTYSHPVEGAPESLVAKFSPPDPGFVFSRHEVSFYREIASGRDFPIPVCYYGETDSETGAGALLLEDLTRLRAVSFLDGGTPEEIGATVDALASIHASWWADTGLADKEWLLQIADTRFVEWWEMYPGKIRTLLPDFEVSRRLMDFGDRFAADMPLVLDRIEGEPFTAIHRDIHLDNLLLASHPDDPPSILVDWQTAGCGKGVSDVAYLLISSLSPADRRESERGLVEMYHRKLLELGVENYAFDRCWSDYVVSVASKLFITVTATALIDNTAPHRRAWRTADLQRLMAFLDDHDPINEL